MRFLSGALGALMLVLAFPAHAALPADLASAGVTQAEWDAVQAQVRRLAREQRVSEQALTAIAIRLGAEQRGPFEISGVLTRLDAMVTRLQDLEQRLGARERARGQLGERSAQARAAIEAGDLDRAEALLRQVSDSQADAIAGARTQLATLRRAHAETLGQRAELALLRGDYRGGAQLFAEAAEAAPESAALLRWRFMLARAGAVTEMRDVSAAREAFAAALALAPRERSRVEWAQTQYELGEALRVLNLAEESEAAHRLALEARSRAREPIAWAQSQAAVADAESLRGIRARDLSLLQEAIGRYHEALSVLTRQNAPAAWAEAQNNFVTALVWAAQVRGGGHARGELEEALATLRTLLEVTPPDTQPQNGGIVLYNIGTVLERLGDSMGAGDERRAAHLEAADTYERAVETLRRGAMFAYASTVERRVSPFIHRVRAAP